MIWDSPTWRWVWYIIEALSGPSSHPVPKSPSQWRPWSVINSPAWCVLFISYVYNCWVGNQNLSLLIKAILSFHREIIHVWMHNYQLRDMMENILSFYFNNVRRAGLIHINLDFSLPGKFPYRPPLLSRCILINTVN